MISRVYFIAIAFLSLTSISAQWADEFTDANLMDDPLWTGDLADWSIENERLTLNAAEPGRSILQTEYILKSGVAVWETSIRLDYAPSNNNYFEWYLQTDGLDLEITSGYLLRIGRNGSDDSLEFYDLVDGDRTLLGMGTAGIASSSPVVLSIQIIVSAEGEWSISSRTSDLDPYALQIFTVTDPFTEDDTRYLSLLANYTTSNVDATEVEYVRYMTMVAEEPEGELTDLTVVSPTQLLLQFNKALDLDEASDESNYFIDGLVISSATPGAPSSGAVNLSLASALINGREYNVEFTISDSQGESIDGARTFRSLFGDVPEVSDLVITEILSDPIGDESDFIEIYNNSAKTFDLRDFKIDNSASSFNPADIIVEGFIQPGEYAAFTEKRLETIDRYSPIADAVIYEQNLPSFSNAEGNVSIIYEGSEEVTIASVDYSEDWHVLLLSDPEGISLERIRVDGEDNSSENWSSSSADGTPGYVNSQNTSLEPTISDMTITPETISPDLDGRDDFALISLGELPSETIGSVRVYSVYGHLVSTLRNNELLSPDIPIRWEGTKDDGSRAELGGYLVVLDYFNLEGATGSKKATIVVATPLD